MADKPGEVMGYLAYGHPFLDGNGRTIMVVHAELAQRAGISVNWAATDKSEYLNALTRELDRPEKGHLDAYLKPFVGPAIGREELSGHIARAPGIGDKNHIADHPDTLAMPVWGDPRFFRATSVDAPFPEPRFDLYHYAPDNIRDTLGIDKDEDFQIISEEEESMLTCLLGQLQRLPIAMPSSTWAYTASGHY